MVRRVPGYKKIRFYSHENIGYGPVNLPDQELHTTAVWWQLAQGVLAAAFDDRQQALDGFLGAAYALHIVATVAVMAEARDLQKSVGSGDGAWFVSADASGRGQLRGADGQADRRWHRTRRSPPPCICTTPSPAASARASRCSSAARICWRKSITLIERCDCRAGCPACVGPVLAADENADSAPEATPKALALRVLALLVAL